MKKYYKLCLVLLWMVLIFWFSNQPAPVSDNKSLFVIQIMKNMGIDLNGIFADAANFIVRKIAHFSEYFILYLLVLNALVEKINIRKALVYSIIVVFLYASSDEIHQFFIPGRACRFQDILIDTSGGVFAAIIVCAIIYSKKLKNNKKSL